jgi:hypothetical protein
LKQQLEDAENQKEFTLARQISLSFFV